MKAKRCLLIDTDKDKEFLDEQLHKVAQEEGQKFYEKGNKQAGVRMRKALMDIKNLAHEIRKDKPSEKK